MKKGKRNARSGTIFHFVNGGARFGAQANHGHFGKSIAASKNVGDGHHQVLGETAVLVTDSGGFTQISFKKNREYCE